MPDKIHTKSAPTNTTFCHSARWCQTNRKKNSTNNQNIHNGVQPTKIKKQEKQQHTHSKKKKAQLKNPPNNQACITETSTKKMTWNINQKDEISTKKMTSNIQKKELLQWLSQTKVTFQVTEQETDLSTYSMMLFCHADQRVVEDAFSLQHCWSWKIRLPVFFHSWKLETTQVTVSKQLHAFGVTVPCSCKPRSNPPSPLWVQKQWLQLQVLFHCMWFIHHFYCSSFIAYFLQKVVSVSYTHLTLPTRSTV